MPSPPKIARIKKETVRLEDFMLDGVEPAHAALMRNDFHMAQRMNDVADVLNAQSEHIEANGKKLDYTNGKVAEAITRITQAEGELKSLKSANIDWPGLLRKGITGGLVTVVSLLTVGICYLALKHAITLLELGKNLNGGTP